MQHQSANSVTPIQHLSPPRRRRRNALARAFLSLAAMVAAAACVAPVAEHEALDVSADAVTNLECPSRKTFTVTPTYDTLNMQFDSMDACRAAKCPQGSTEQDVEWSEDVVRKNVKCDDACTLEVNISPFDSYFESDPDTGASVVLTKEMKCQRVFTGVVTKACRYKRVRNQQFGIRAECVLKPLVPRPTSGSGATSNPGGLELSGAGGSGAGTNDGGSAPNVEGQGGSGAGTNGTGAGAAIGNGAGADDTGAGASTGGDANNNG